ncbi:MAG: hypothetical protein KY439_01005 [Actinobacteria bacterium]|nr:hypothetical protein [Actinomycetota bacterium]
MDQSTDPLLPGGRELVALGRAVSQRQPDRGRLDAVASRIGLEAAIDAAAVAANFQVMNRVVDATGLPVGRRRREENVELITRLKLDEFPHSQH